MTLTTVVSDFVDQLAFLRWQKMFFVTTYVIFGRWSDLKVDLQTGFCSQEDLLGPGWRKIRDYCNYIWVGQLIKFDFYLWLPHGKTRFLYMVPVSLWCLFPLPHIKSSDNWRACSVTRKRCITFLWLEYYLFLWTVVPAFCNAVSLPAFWTEFVLDQ